MEPSRKLFHIWSIGLRAALLASIAGAVLQGASAREGAGPAPRSPYEGCLLFVDDIRTDAELRIAARFRPDTLIRSWYRWGEPPHEKEYARRRPLLARLAAAGIAVGGGSSLSVVNDRDLGAPDFDRAWLAVDLAGRPIADGDKRYGSLSAPGFRRYLIRRLVAQARLGLGELHLGESNGRIGFDDWSLGIAGSGGFIPWVKARHPGKERAWWVDRFDALGAAIAHGWPVTRALIQGLRGRARENFELEWGVPGSWHGLNRRQEPAFLGDLYAANLDAFLGELREVLRREGLGHVRIDVWGVSDWMHRLKHQPDAYISSPPDERWGIAWSTDPAYPLVSQADRIRRLMAADIHAFAPVPMVYMIDHPQPFTRFLALPDERQAYLLTFLAGLSHDVGANFVLPSYSYDQARLGPNTARAIEALCARARSG